MNMDTYYKAYFEILIIKKKKQLIQRVEKFF